MKIKVNHQDLLAGAASNEPWDNPIALAVSRAFGVKEGEGRPWISMAPGHGTITDVVLPSGRKVSLPDRVRVWAETMEGEIEFELD